MSAGTAVQNGWLEKRYPASADGAWTRRWCVLDPERLSYYADEQMTNLKGDIGLTERSRAVPFLNGDAPGDGIKHRTAKPFGFVLDVDPELGKRRHLYYFNANEEQQMSAWLQGVDTAVTNLVSANLSWRLFFCSFELSGEGKVQIREFCFMMNRIIVDGSCTWKTPEEVADMIANYQSPMGYSDFAAWAAAQAPSAEHIDRAIAMGNCAQRFYDCLYPDRAIIDVLSILDKRSCRELMNVYPSIFGGESLYEAIVKKISDQDGFVCSNYYKKVITSLLDEEVLLWARAINDSMAGLGTDDFSLAGLVCTMPNELRDNILKKYEELYGKTMCDMIESETSFDFKRVLMFQTMDKPTRVCRVLNAAMEGVGTNEENLIRVLLTCTVAERQGIKERYSVLYGKELIDHIQSETHEFFEGSFRKALIQFLIAEEEPADLEEACHLIEVAMRGWGTDETMLTKAICSKTRAQIAEIIPKFEELYQRSLFDWVKSETSRNYQEFLLGMLRPPVKQLAHGIRGCLKGLGTDDTGLAALLVQHDRSQMSAIMQAYREEFGRELVEDIKADTMGNYEDALLALTLPAPVTWAKGLLSSMKGIGTSDDALINWMCIAKDRMSEVRTAFSEVSTKALPTMIDQECSGDYKHALVALAKRNPDDHIEQGLPFFAQRMKDAFGNWELLQDLVINLPCSAIDRAYEIFKTKRENILLPDEVKSACEAACFFPSMSSNWINGMASLAESRAGLFAKALKEAMDGIGTDEYSLTALVCTVPEALCENVVNIYQQRYGTSLIDRIESETSFAYKKVLVYQLLPRAQSRAKALNGAMAGLGTSEDQLIRITMCATMLERKEIREAYPKMYNKDLLEHIASETSGSFKDILLGTFECIERKELEEGQLETECKQLKDAMDGMGTDEATLIRILTSKTPDQIELLKEKYLEVHLESLTERIDGETWWDFFSSNFREAILLLMTGDRMKQLAKCVRDCIKGWGTDDTGLITSLVKLTESEKQELQRVYPLIAQEKELIDDIKSDTSGEYEKALLALFRPDTDIWAEALIGAMKGLGTCDALLVNWVCIAKPRMPEVRCSFAQRCKEIGYEYEAVPEDEETFAPPAVDSEVEKKTSKSLALAKWIEGECSGDYKDLLVQLAKLYMD